MSISHPLDSLPATGGYYVSRPPGKVDFTDYWEPRADPDGVVRDRLTDAERVQYLEDNANILEFCESLPPSYVMDIGCGPGWLLDALPDTWNRFGIEASARACGVAQIDIALDDWRFYWQLLHAERPFFGTRHVTDNSVVIVNHVIEHEQQPYSLIMFCHAALSKGGWLILGTPDFASPCARRFGDNYRLLHDTTHVSLFSLESMHRFLADHGFRVERVDFPFPERYATPKNFARWNDTTKVSPPWPGNFMTFFARKI